MKKWIPLALAFLGACRAPVRLSEPDEPRATHSARRRSHDPEPEQARTERRALSLLPTVRRTDLDALDQITTSLASLCVRLDSDSDPTRARFQCGYEVATGDGRDRIGALRYRLGRWELVDRSVADTLRTAGETLRRFHRVHLVVAGFVDCLPVRERLPSCTDQPFLDPVTLTGELADCRHTEQLRPHDPRLNRCLAWCRAAGVARALLDNQAPADSVSVAIVGGDTAWAGLCPSEGGAHTAPPGHCARRARECAPARKVELVFSLQPADTQERVGCEAPLDSPRSALACLEESYARRNASLVSFHGDGGTPGPPATLPSAPLIHQIGLARLPDDVVLGALNLRPPSGSP
jgi:hypothetical protein